MNEYHTTEDLDGVLDALGLDPERLYKKIMIDLYHGEVEITTLQVMGEGLQDVKNSSKHKMTLEQGKALLRIFDCKEDITRIKIIFDGKEPLVSVYLKQNIKTPDLRSVLRVVGKSVSPDAPDPEDPDWMEQLTTHTDELMDLREEQEYLAKKLKESKERSDVLEQRTIPDIMDLHKLELIKLKSGFSVSVIADLKCKIAASTQDKAFEWLEEGGHGGVIKREFHIDFPKEEESWANKFERDLAQRVRPLNVSRKKSVHSGTLKALLKGETTKGYAFTDEEKKMFGIYTVKNVKIT